MENPIKIKEVVKEKYSQIARGADLKIKKRSCCGGNEDEVYTIMADEYKSIDGYVADADLGLGCGLPTEFAQMKEGDTVLDLGSGAGNDVFIARRIVGEKGKVIGIDFTEAMINKANKNKEKLGYSNVEFKLGEIENLPIENETIDVVISNCVLNLVPDKRKAFSEIHRVLKSTGHFCVSDIMLSGQLPEKLAKAAEIYAGCVAGALQKDEYINIVKQIGFKNIELKKEKVIEIPRETLRSYLSGEEVREYFESNSKIYSITLFANAHIGPLSSKTD